MGKRRTAPNVVEVPQTFGCEIWPDFLRYGRGGWLYDYSLRLTIVAGRTVDELPLPLVIINVVLHNPEDAP